MANVYLLPSSRVSISNLIKPHITCTSSPKNPISQISYISSTSHPNPISSHLNLEPNERKETIFIPTMCEIMESSKSQNIDLELQTLGPFFRIRARSLESKREIGRAEGVIRVWWGEKILHLDSIKLGKETVCMERSIFGIGLFVGAVAIRYGYDCGCTTAQLLAINDSDLYHSKLVRFYTRFGFKMVHEVNGSSMGDAIHMLVWGGKGSRMDADIKQLLIKWGRRFKARN